ncbi:hypothetical protein E8E13_008065 [Curvularia kusanoi]|uniref:Uncharacterized protein n=1 Tax=Curvularia kusanoi TaxID=90978 RepID=A0A9P4TI47_CURKU|nr:hypothetical protein E8E13_008065 [Curvularia kusanoi]
MPLSPSPTPLPTTNGSSSFPYRWDEIATRLGLASSKDIPVFILTSSFMGHWAKLRDDIPLKPGNPDPVDMNYSEDRAVLTAFTSTIYTAMDSMAASKYDRPSPNDKESWTSHDHIECLVYRSARDLAQLGHLFHSAFERHKLKNEAGRKDALSRIRGLIMLTFNLMVNYTLMPPSNVIRKIEAAMPASQPRYSPLPEVRRRWELQRLDVGDLRKTVLDRHRKGEDEKEWLIKILMEDGKYDAAVEGEEVIRLKSEEGMRGVSVKRKIGEVEQDERDDWS